MQMKFKKTGAALLVATMTVTGASYAWANENLFDTVDLNEVLNQKETETVEAPKTSTPDTVTPVVTTGDSVGLDIEIPEGYTAGNLAALSKAYENAGNETAKAAIKRNAERAIAKFEAKQAETTEPIKEEEPKQEDPIVQPPVTEQPKTEEPVVETPIEEPVKEEPVEEKPVVEQPKKETKQAEKEERKALQQEQKEERKALQAEHKEEKTALKEEHKAEKHENKKN
ncbi:hypothetical protein [Psychrobacillus psychrodurans]|uniref:hypothetical protein n=1 Tax=Psychrobacillus psychrodurans TaxID=126157 RepID=UPI0008F02A1C|nr:hypothetical protein [Psychrobacillus psychrodurans]MCZ8539018.1 hypothetical protein [Psychrobacillus psychrodurans]SFM26987.1 hypothetical protein SAMN05421832_101376 [Psychrobacillus psychrodurans]